MERKNLFYPKCLKQVIFLVLMTLLLSNCSHGPTDVSSRTGLDRQKVFTLKEITPDDGKTLLSEMGLGTVSVLPDHKALAVTGPPSELQKASVILDLVDTKQEYVIETLAPVSAARSMPTNDQIAEALGDIDIGTFADPPEPGRSARAIIDIHSESVVAIIPRHFQREVGALVELGPGALRQAIGDTKPSAQAESEMAQTPACEPSVKVQRERAEVAAPPVAAKYTSPELLSTQVLPDLPKPSVAEAKSEAPVKTQLEPAQKTTESVVSEKPLATDEAILASERDIVSQIEQQTATCHRTAQEPSRMAAKPAKNIVRYELVSLTNGEDILELDLPDRLEMIDLLDLVAEYLNLDYMYDPEKIGGQEVSLRLHGKLQGEIRVKDLYPLLESVLKFKGFAMTCHKGSLVTIVPVTDALQVDPALVDPHSMTIGAGDLVVTRVFDLQYVNTSSAMNLLDNMKLSVAASPIKETQSLIVTCYAHRMARIERLLNMVDRPGRPKEFRFRQLKYTMAKTLAKKVEKLAAELQMIPVMVAPMEKQSSSPVLTLSTSSRSSSPPQGLSTTVGSNSSANTCAVYLDVDERTNRILMIGHAEQLAIVDEVIDALDVVQHDLRTMKVYDIVHLIAADVKKKLEELEVIGKPSQASGAFPSVFTSKTSSSGMTGAAGTVEGAVMEEIQVTVLEATNSLLINATEEQHARIEVVIDHVDVAPQDIRTLKVYDIQYVDADEVKKKLSEFELIGKKPDSAGKSATVPASTPLPSTATGDGGKEDSATMQEAQVAVLESTNSLLINATEFQHAQMANVIRHVDAKVRQEAIPYEIYFLENQDPEALAEVLGKLIHERIKDKEDKVEQVVRKTEDEIVIVPDKGTFSLVVYASKKNQEWISKLIKALDRRRPQVLIDVTLVEIRKTDEFNYDLNLITSMPDLVETGGQTGSLSVDDQTVVEKLLESDTRNRFIDFQANAGTGTGFYADIHVNALLTAMQTKNYGRVLAKPKVLVNDNEKGMIQTADITYVEKKSSIPVISGAAGTPANLIETAIAYEAYDAGITLEITPHISEGELLRLEITLSRSDFGTITGERPPDQTSSDISTVVTVPDGSTIILGGMLKLNQSKGGSKVPILGDLPLVGGLFRSIANSDVQSKLYVFVRAEVIRPTEALAGAHEDLERISERNRDAFERHEEQFQNYEDWPGIQPKPMEPQKVLEAE